MKPLSPEQNLGNYCYMHLREAIIKGDFAPGEKLQIAKLKQRLNVGPTPIREALSRLTSSGLIVLEDNKGFRVKNISATEITDIYSTINKIELLALSQAIDLGDESWEAGIVASLYKLALIEMRGQPPVDRFDWMQKNYEFHLSLVVGCNSPCLLKIRKDLFQLFERYCYLSLLINERVLVSNHKEHRNLAQAVLDRDKDLACKLTTKHLQQSLTQILERIDLLHNLSRVNK